MVYKKSVIHLSVFLVQHMVLCWILVATSTDKVYDLLLLCSVIISCPTNVFFPFSFL